MNSSVFPTLRGLSYLFLLHFLVLALTMIYGCSSSQRGCSHYETMPVVTRSKARMIRSSINEEHTLQLTSNILKNETTCSIHEHILTDKSSPASNNELLSIVLSSSSSSSICNSVINTEQLPSSSPLGVSFQGDTPTNFSNFRNFKIPNFHTTEFYHWVIIPIPIILQPCIWIVKIVQKSYLLRLMSQILANYLPLCPLR